MWAQMIESRLKPGRQDDLHTLTAQLKAAERSGSGLIHATATQDAKDPGRVILFLVFESEEKAREREGDVERQQELTEAQSVMQSIFDGVPVFTDLSVIEGWTAG